MIDVIIIIGIVAIFGLTIFISIRNKKKGKSSCGCDCATCSSCSLCKTKENNPSKK